MFVNPSLAQALMEERVKDALREAERKRLIRAAKGPRQERKWRVRMTLILERTLAIFTDRRVDEPRRRSPSTVASPACESCSGS